MGEPNRDDLDQRIVASNFLRPVVARGIGDESSTSLECVRLCNAVINAIDSNRDREEQVTAEMKAAIYGVWKKFKEKGAK